MVNIGFINRLVGNVGRYEHHSSLVSATNRLETIVVIDGVAPVDPMDLVIHSNILFKRYMLL